MNTTPTPAEFSESVTAPEASEFRPGLMVLGILSSLLGISLIITVALLPFDAAPLGLELATVIIGLMVIFSVLLIGGGFGIIAVAAQKLRHYSTSEDQTQQTAQQAPHNSSASSSSRT